MTLPGCATLTHGTSQSVDIWSSPDGANVTVDGRNLGTTPLRTDLRRGQPHVVQVEKDGYLAETVMTTTKMNKATSWNALFGLAGAVAIVVDMANGSATDVTPDAVSVDLVEKVSPPSTVVPASYEPSSDQGRVRLN
jgi:hypothetical protein